MRHLVDACVLSEATKPEPTSQVVEWLRRNERSIVVDPVILGEVRFGILLLKRSSRRAKLEQWFKHGVVGIQCIPWDRDVGMRWAQLLADLRRRGQPMSVKDSLIAATALSHDLPVVTLNRRDFEPSKVRLIDPLR